MKILAPMIIVLALASPLAAAEKDLRAEVAALRKEVAKLRQQLKALAKVVTRHESATAFHRDRLTTLLDAMVTLSEDQAETKARLKKQEELNRRQWDTPKIVPTVDPPQPEPKPSKLYLRRWFFHNDGTLEITMANHSDKPIRIKSITVPNSDGVINFNLFSTVRAGGLFTHKVRVSSEPVMFKLGTSVGELTFDLVREHH